jgi:hypothetical protein
MTTRTVYLTVATMPSTGVVGVPNVGRHTPIVNWLRLDETYCATVTVTLPPGLVSPLRT